MCDLRYAAMILLTAVTFASFSDQSHVAAQSATARGHSRNQQAVTGPRATMNQAIAGGPTATVTMQPVPPKTQPPSNYPMGTTIVGQTISLGSVPARVWLELYVTGWAPEDLRLVQVRIDATDTAGDGGGYSGAGAECAGVPVSGAGDLFPAIIPCTGGTCQGNPAMSCFSNANCGSEGPCLNPNGQCREEVSGLTSGCFVAEPSRCGSRPAFFPPGGPVCQYAFQNQCRPDWIATGMAGLAVVDLGSLNMRLCSFLEPGNSAIDFHPSYLGNFVLDVPATAKGRYRIDFTPGETFMQNHNNPPDNDIPIAVYNIAVIQTTCGSCCTNFDAPTTCTDGLSEAECDALPTTNARVYRPGTTCDQADCCDCTTNAECQDNDVCTVDACQNSCYCTHTPVAGWIPDTECCHPMTGVQSPIPQSSSCRIGGCSFGGSSGMPTQNSLPNGTACVHDDPCYLDGFCNAGGCESEQYAVSDCPKARFITFEPNSITGSNSSAYRVRLVSLHHPDPPYDGGETSDFSAFEGQVRWVGPPGTFSESTSDSTEVLASFVQCQPHYQNWLGFEPLHVTGSAIVPSSEYEVQSIAQGLDINIESNYSAPITILTSRWGDVIIPYTPPGTSTQPNAGDMSALVDKFKSASSSISKPRALLTGPDAGGNPNLSIDVSFADIAAVVDGHNGLPYPYTGPDPCP